jgi:hypothetical protein
METHASSPAWAGRRVPRPPDHPVVHPDHQTSGTAMDLPAPPSWVMTDPDVDALGIIFYHMIIDKDGKRPSVPSWASACALVRVCKGWREPVRQALLGCDHFKGDLEWTPLNPVVGYEVSCSNHNLRKVTWTGGVDVTTALFNLELHQSVHSSKGRYSLVENDEENDPEGTIGITIVRPALSLKPSVVMWCKIDFDETSSKFLEPLMAFDKDTFLGVYHGVELDLWNAVRTFSLRDVRHQMFKMTELLHKEANKAVHRIKLQSSMQTWNTWNMSGEVGELNEHRTNAVPIKVVPSAPVSCADDYKVKELKTTSPCLLFSSGMEDDAADREDGAAKKHWLNTGLMGEWTMWETHLHISTRTMMAVYPDILYRDIENFGNDLDSKVYTVKQKLIVRNMDFKNDKCTEGRETNKKLLYTGSGDKRRQTWLNPLSIYCGYNAPDDVLRMGDGFYRIATSELVKPMMPSGLGITGLADTSEKMQELKNFYTSLKFTKVSQGSSSSSTSLTLYSEEDAGGRQSTRKAAGKAKAIAAIEEPDSDSDSGSNSDYERDGSADEEDEDEDEDDDDDDEDEPSPPPAATRVAAPRPSRKRSK